jgi:putative membrane-bound dehydrogenase-like protein
MAAPGHRDDLRGPAICPSAIPPVEARRRTAASHRARQVPLDQTLFTMKMRSLSTALCLCALALRALSAGPLTPSQAQKSFDLDPGLTIELVAAEPDIISPAAIAWDESGRMFVVENPGYPVGPGPGKPPVGKLVELVDADRDGRAERRIDFATGLTFPNGLMAWRGGWLITDSPDIVWLADTNNDGRADVREVWFTGFNTNLTTQLRACYPTVGPDGWIYVSRGWNGGRIRSPKWTNLPEIDLNSGGDFRFRPDGSAAEAIGGNAQFGLIVDDFGRRFLVSNRNPLMQAVTLPAWWRRNPFLPSNELVHDVSPTGYDAKVFPLSTDTTTAGFSEEFLSKPHAGTYTSACGIRQYFGDGLPKDFDGSWFICEPAQNLVQRQVAAPHGAALRSQRAGREDRDFLASPDGWFRPVYAATGPDGALYLADMYRRTIDHPDYLPEDARKKLDFDSGKDMGRLWRVRGTDRKVKPTTLASRTTAEWVADLGSPNGWVRETAHRLLLERASPSTPALLRETLSRSEDAPAGTARRLQLLAALRDSSARTALFAAFTNPSPAVRLAAWKTLAQPGETNLNARLQEIGAERLRAGAEDSSGEVRFHVALMCGGSDWPVARELLVALAGRPASDRWLRAAILSGVRGWEGAFAEAMLKAASVAPQPAAPQELFHDLGRMLGANADAPLGGFWNGVLADAASGTVWQMSALQGLSEGLRSRGGTNLNAALSAHADGDGKDRAAALRGAFAAVAARCVALATNTTAGLPARLAATRFLAEIDFAAARAPLLGALAPSAPRELQLSAARSLGQFDLPEVAELLTEPDRWNAYSPAVREVVLGSLLSRPTFLPGLLSAVEGGTVPPWAIEPKKREQLRKHSDPGIKARAEKVFAAGGGGDRRKAYEESKPVLALKADAARGHEVFLRACALCHQHSGEGVKVGPDLTGVRNQPVEALLLHIVVPEAEIYPGFQNYEVETRDGRNLGGLLATETDETITLRRAGGEQDTVQRANIASLRMSALSLMPQELEKAMTPQELADLLAFLKAAPRETAAAAAPTTRP